MFSLNLPDISDIKNPIISAELPIEEMQKFITSTRTPQYLCWDKIKYRPIEGISSRELWAITKSHRKYTFNNESIFTDEGAQPFIWNSALPHFEKLLHKIDLSLGGNLQLSTAGVLNKEKQRNQFILHGIMEEAIASSQLEGASTTRDIAKNMLLENRRPRTHDEKMILNNYEAMQFVVTELGDKKIKLEDLLELHNILTKGTLKKENEVGRLRKVSEKIIVGDDITGEIYHVPPEVDFLKNELNKFIDYANDDLTDHNFVHPVIKGIILHFWIGYLHPFVDGNGRMARSIFYWYLIKNGYWGFQYLPLSKIIKEAPKKYGMAYVYTEQDDNDLTYFIDYNMRKIGQALTEFEEYIKRKESENAEVLSILNTKKDLNIRQINLLQYFYKKPRTSTTIKTHMGLNHISRLTAITDLDQLYNLGFLEIKKQKRVNHYFSTEKVKSLF